MTLTKVPWNGGSIQVTQVMYEVRQCIDGLLDAVISGLITDAMTGVRKYRREAHASHFGPAGLP